MSQKDPLEEPTCPVDHSSREVWLQASKQLQPPPPPPPRNVEQPLPAKPSPTTSGWLSRLSFWSSTDQEHQARPTLAPPPHLSAASARPGLGTERTVSSIPRTMTPGPSSCPATEMPPSQSQSPQPQPQQPQKPPLPPSPNAETDSPSTSASGNWIYPSEAQFFAAVQRKGHTSTRPSDMTTVVPIHNAVNERTWSEILTWEAPYSAVSRTCGGPKLHSFSGDSKKLTPKARLMALFGYQKPFDRHDWVVDRCGTRVEYVIDFYQGRAPQSDGGDDKSARDMVSFYLDVRPKLNSLEGIKMRVLRGLGVV